MKTNETGILEFMIRLPQPIADIYRKRKEVAGLAYSQQAMRSIYKDEIIEGEIKLKELKSD